MPPKKRSQHTPSVDATYRSTDAASPQQQRFSHRRRSVKTYGRPKPGRKLKQETLTQMNFTSSVAQDVVGLVDDDDDDDDDDEYGNQENEENQEEVDVKPTRPVKKVKAGVKSRTNRRKTTGDQLDSEERPHYSKRRKTLGDSPNPRLSSSVHTQTLTQMVSTNIKDEDSWQIDDSEDDKDSELVMETPKRSPVHLKKEPPECIMSAVPSLIKSATPAHRLGKIEIPSSQSPLTPMLLRYDPAPQDSPLAAKSTNAAAPSPILKTLCKTPRNAVIPDSYSTTHHSSPASIQKSTVKATPAKKLTFDIPGDKENITPGRKKPKTPKTKTQAIGRQPLREVPDSDEDFGEDPDETEYETTEDEEVVLYDPESPTRYRTAMPRAKPPEAEKPSPEAVRRPLEEVAESVIPSESQLQDHERDLASRDKLPSLRENEQAASNLPKLVEQDCHPSSPKIVYDVPSSETRAEVSMDDHTVNHVLGLGLSAEVGAEVETPLPNLRTRRGTADSSPTPKVGQNLELASSQQAGNGDMAGDLSSPWQGDSNFYTQGLESQRLPLDSVRALGPQTPHSDIMVSLHPEHIAKIVDRTKNHEFRAWKIPQQVSRIWIYITRPESQLKYMCLFGEPKAPGEIKDEKGIGNVEFNQGKTPAKFAYEILQVYELNNPVSLDEMKKKGWVSGAPQKYTYIPPAVVGEITANLRCALFGDAAQLDSSPGKKLSESQELGAQLKSEASYSTQHYSGATDEIIPESQWPRQSNVSSETLTGGGTFARPALSRVRSISSNHGSPQLSNQRQRSFVRPSQATTVSQGSSSPVISPEKPGPHPILISSDSGGSPAELHRSYSSLRSSQFPSRSQMLPESLLNKDIHEPPAIVWDSADEHSD
ncbi:hypothetical protein F4861DRAFT_41808 [Xylaria intraflava]|nr:hypothetical protein F4861DRAFT_41808 [Xylaria intraflava]